MKQPGKNNVGKGATAVRGKKSVSKGRRQKEQPVVEVIPKKRIIMPDRSVMQIRVLSPEHRELKEVVDTEVKSPPPTMKRRTTMQNFTLIIPKEKIEKEDIDEHQRAVIGAEERKTRALEWRAQFRGLADVAPRREKSEQQRVKSELIRVVHAEESDSQLKPRLEKSFWEKLGFQDKKKEDRNMKEGKETVDIVFRTLKETISKRLVLVFFY